MPKYVLLVVIFCVACGGETQKESPKSGLRSLGTSSGLQRLEAYRLPEELSQVRVNGNAADVGWRRAREVVVPLHGEDGHGPKQVTVKAIYSERFVYFLLIWRDEQMDQNCFCRFEEPGRWRMHEGEDAAMLLFAPSSQAEPFRARGFDLVVKNGEIAHPKGRGFFDAWYWGVQTTRPQNRARDHWLRPDQKLRGDSQPEDSDNMPNWNSAQSTPAGVPKRGGKKALDVLHWRDSIALTPQRMALMTAENNFGWKVPGVLTRKMLGSRADVHASARFANGAWIMELARRLDTGNRDDHVLGDAMHTALFALAIWDGTGRGVYPGRYGAECSRSAAIELVFLSQS